MSVKQKYERIFGRIDRLSDEIPWTTGLSNMVEHLLWDTKSVLGISKTRFWKQIVEWSLSEDPSKIEEKIRVIDKKLKELLKVNEAESRYERPRSNYCSPREVLRRNKYFSEDYLNKEFDVFLNLSSDAYLTELYEKFYPIEPGSQWSTHGNSGLFAYSTDLSEMKIDNLAYNVTANILVANELKLGGKRNPDQIVKYAYMFNKLEQKGFVEAECQSLLLFLGGRKENLDVAEEMEKEIEFCKRTGRERLLSDDVTKKAKTLQVFSMTWAEFIDFNDQFMSRLSESSQVEKKLLKGFNISIKEKAYMQGNF